MTKYLLNSTSVFPCVSQGETWIASGYDCHGPFLDRRAEGIQPGMVRQMTGNPYWLVAFHLLRYCNENKNQPQNLHHMLYMSIES